MTAVGDDSDGDDDGDGDDDSDDGDDVGNDGNYGSSSQQLLASCWSERLPKWLPPKITKMPPKITTSMI